MKATISVRGIFQLIHVNSGRIIVYEHNAIHEDLLDYLSRSLNETVDDSLQDLFDEMLIVPGLTQDGKDGIAIFDADGGDWLTMTTDPVAPTQAYGRRWRGDVTPGVTFPVTQFAVGHNYLDASPFPFTTTMAFKLTDPVEFLDSNDYRIYWEIFLAPGAQPSES